MEHGHDEKGCILFTAFLCQRLLEISKEERAAMVVQRHWRNRQQDKPGTPFAAAWHCNGRLVTCSGTMRCAAYAVLLLT